jgi:hypothetical protein
MSKQSLLDRFQLALTQPLNAREYGCTLHEADAKIAPETEAKRCLVVSTNNFRTTTRPVCHCITGQPKQGILPLVADSLPGAMSVHGPASSCAKVVAETFDADLDGTPAPSTVVSTLFDVERSERKDRTSCVVCRSQVDTS